MLGPGLKFRSPVSLSASVHPYLYGKMILEKMVQKNFPWHGEPYSVFNLREIMIEGNDII